MGEFAEGPVRKPALPAAEPAATPDGAKPHYLNHRARLRERFLRGGAEALPDYELLELVLFLAIPQKDVKPIAKALLARFNNNFAEVLNAPIDKLVAVSGVKDGTAVALKTVLAAARRLGQAEIMRRDVIGNWDKLIHYCRMAMGLEQIEQFRILFLDRKNGLIADEVQQRGTVDHTPVYPREVIKRALDLGASAIIMVHNHPSGDPTPSKADIDMTKEIARVGLPLGVALHDHIIITRGDHVSFKGLGIL